MHRKLLSLVLTFTMILSLVPGAFPEGGEEHHHDHDHATVQVAEASAAEYTPVPSDYFYDQLNPKAQAIYRLLYKEFSESPAKYQTGTEFIDLMQLAEVTIDDVETYLKGNKDIFNDFAAAKDALDLDHSELWWLDSGYLSFRVTKEGSEYHVLIGPGRGDTYLLGGAAADGMLTGKTIATMDEEVEAAISRIVKQAKDDLARADSGNTYTEADRKAALVRSVHDQITRTISYCYEIDCSDVEYGKFIRTTYALVTHQGVCESYARSMQVCLSRLGIESVLVHGVQSRGTPEDHMWNEIRIDDGNTERWYATDATFDDPIPTDWYGKRDVKTENEGNDGRETITYLLVGQSVVGEYWLPSGLVSSSAFEFQYPPIETASFDGSTAYSDASGLQVKYSAGSASVEGVPAGVFSITFQGMNSAQAKEKGLFFLIKMMDYHPDGTSHVMDEWYYVEATLHILQNRNPYFGDWDEGLRVYSATCEYIQVAVTSRQPDHFEKWSYDPKTNYLSQSKENAEAGYFHGTDDDIIAISDMLYNVNASYEAPPYVLTQTPVPNATHTAGYDYRVKVTWDDDLYHPMPESEALRLANAAVEDDPSKAFDTHTAQAMTQQVRIRYLPLQQDLRTYETVVAQIAGYLPFDDDRDGYVDLTQYTNLQWMYTCDQAHDHDVQQGCRFNGVEFNFKGSDMWMDDITEYSFSVEGVVGSRSEKAPNSFGITVQVPGLCPACYRKEGWDWNLWGKPTLLDAPENLDLAAMAANGGTDETTLNELKKQINTNGLNGRLMLVVEDNSKGAGNREEYQKVNDRLETQTGLKDSDILSSSVYEINFNRICPMVKLKPGNSLRVQVGYPHGITYEMLTSGEGNKVIKGYHFTRCDTDHLCDNQDKEGHEWGDDIVGVDEINVIPTPYGMIIQCTSFSPFELVVLDGDSPTVQAAVKKSRFSAADTIVSVVSDGNGVVKMDGDRECVGEDGNIVYTESTTHTFTAEPKDGYVVDTVSFGGTEIKVDGNNSFTLSSAQVEHSDILNVNFIAQEVQAEVSNLGETQVAQVCTHSETKKIPENGVETDTPATCTTKGHALEVRCAKCDQLISEAKDIPPLGHTPVEKTPAKKPTCTQPGNFARTECANCPAILSNGEQIDPLGHLFLNYEDTDTVTCKGTVMKASCDRPGCSEINTVTDTTRRSAHQWDNAAGKCTVCESTCEHKNITSTGEFVEATCENPGKSPGEKCSDCGHVFKEASEVKPKGHKFINEICVYCNKQAAHQPGNPVRVEPTCTRIGYERVRCQVCNTVITETPIEKKPHTWNAETGKCSVCREDCPHDGEKTDVPGEDASCTETGREIGKKCKICGYLTEPGKTIRPLGHQERIETPEKAASCTETGTRAKIVCDTCGETIQEPEVTPVLGHTYKDGKCIRCEASDPECSHPEDQLSDYGTAKAPTCTEEGITAGKWCNLCDTLAEAPEPIEATGHSFDASGYCSKDAFQCPHTDWGPGGICNLCKFQRPHRWSSDTGTCVDCGTPCPHDNQEDIAVPADCVDDGYEHTRCKDCGKSIGEPKTLPATGHSWGADGICDICDYQCLHDDVEKIGVDKDATCEEPGSEAGLRCRDCGMTMKAEQTIAALGHTEAAIGDAVDPTCQIEGKTAGTKCSVCLKVLVPQETLYRSGHVFENGKCKYDCGAVDPNCQHPSLICTNEAIDATCTTDGTTAGTICAHCGARVSQPEVIQATGHRSVARNAKDPTCTEPGQTEDTVCEVCETLISAGVSVNAKGHTWSEEGKCLTCGIDRPAEPPVTVTISFDANGGSGTMGAVTVEAGNYTLPSCAFTAPAGQEFDCWSVNGEDHAAGDQITVTADTTVKAVWKDVTPPAPTSFKVTFDANGGTGAMSDVSVNANTDYELPACGFGAPYGKAFAGWDVNGTTHAVGDEIRITGNTTVKAVWQETSYRITFAANGGTGTMAEVTVPAGGKFTLPACGFTAPEGKEFAGWLVANNVYQAGEFILVGQDVTVTAQWKEAATWTITYIDGRTNGTVTSVKITTGQALGTLPAAPSHSGYDFDGWYTQDGTRAYPNLVPTADTTFYGRYSVHYEPSYDSGSSSGTPSTPATPSKPDGTVSNPDGSTTTTETRPNGTVTETTERPDGSTTEVVTEKNGTVTTTETKADGSVKETVERKDGTSTTKEELADGTKTVTETKKDGSSTSTTDKPDGTKTVTETRTDGSSNSVTDKPDGTRIVTDTDKDGASTTTGTTPAGVVANAKGENGAMTEAKVTIPEQAVTEEKPVTVPLEVEAVKTAEEAAPIEVKSEKEGATRVEIPVTEPNKGTVAIRVLPDGTEEIIRESVVSENGVVLNVEGDATIKIVDNTKDFPDVAVESAWAGDAVDFVSSRELFNGTEEHTFSPRLEMSRGMLVTVLYRLDYEPEAAAADFPDVVDNTWYSDAVAWAAETGVVNGYSNGSFGPNDDITREQMVTILYRYATAMGYDVSGSRDLSGYADAGQVSGYAKEAMQWAIGTGLVNGTDASHLSPLNHASRAEVATILMRFCENVVR